MIKHWALATGELTAMQWAGMDLERRTVRFVDTKNSKSAVPAVAILRDAPVIRRYLQLAYSRD